MEPYQAVSYVSGIQFLELQTETNTKIPPIADGVSEKSDNNKDSQRKKTSVCLSEKSVVKSGCFYVKSDNNKGTNCASKSDDDQPVEKKHILQELMIFQRLKNEHEVLCWKRLSLESSSDVEKERMKNALDILRESVAEFVREVVIDSAKQENCVDLLNEVKAGIRMVEQKNFEANRGIEKLEKKQKQKQNAKKKNNKKK